MIERTIREGIQAFNERQRDSNRLPLTTIESNMLVQILHEQVRNSVGQLREELERAAQQADLETQRDLDWATDIIVAFIRMDNRMSLKLNAEKVQKFAAGFNLRVEHSEGEIDLELNPKTEAD